MANSSWNVSGGEWSVSTNWTNGVPGQTDNATIANGGTATVSGSDDPTVGGVSVTNGTLNIGSEIYVGTTTVGSKTFTLDAGSGNININSGGLITGQYLATATGTINLSNQGTYQFNSFQADSTGNIVNFQSASTFQDLTAFQGSIQGFASGDIISFNGTVSSVSYSGNNLTVQTSQGQYALRFVGNYTASNFDYSQGYITYQNAAPAPTPPSYAIAIDPTTVAEGTAAGSAGTLTYTVTRTGASDVASTVAVALSGTATPPGGTVPDYSDTLQNGQVTFAAGATTASFTVTTTPDSTFERDETVIATLGTPSDGGAVTTASATGTITNDDAAPSYAIAVTPAAVAEGTPSGAGNALIYTVTRTGASDVASTVAVTLAGTATPPGGTVPDYSDTLQNGQVTFAAGATTAQFTVTTVPDATFERDETVVATLSTPSDGGAVTQATAVGFITNDDAAPSYAVAVTPAAVAEGTAAGNAGTLTYTVTRTGASDVASTVAVALSGTATPPGGTVPDYSDTLQNGQVAFAAGATTASFTVTTTPDSTFEPDETVIATLGTPSDGGAVTTASATGTITNDDAAPDQGSNSSTSTNGPDYQSVPAGASSAGLSGNDTIVGASSNILFGNEGNDLITAGPGPNTVYGGMGDDTISAGDGNNLLYGNEGADSITAGNGDNTIVGGQDSTDGADVIRSGSGNDLILGNGGDDTVAAGGGADTVVGGYGRDNILGNQGNDILLGNQGDDTLFGGMGNDTLFGGQGNDVLSGNEGDDVFYGNEGLNTFVFSPGDTDFKSGLSTGDTIMDFASGTSRIDFASGPVGTATDFGSATTTAKDFASAQALAQTLINGGDAYAFVANGTDGYLFTNGGSGTAITDAIKLTGAGAAGAVKYTDIAHGALA